MDFPRRPVPDERSECKPDRAQPSRDDRSQEVNVKLKALCICIVGSVVFLALPALAHHSHGNYDTTTWTPFEGVVTELHLITPHSFVYLEVKDDKGQPAIWLL